MGNYWGSRQTPGQVQRRSTTGLPVAGSGSYPHPGRRREAELDDIEADVDTFETWLAELDEECAALREELATARKMSQWAWADVERSQLPDDSPREQHREALQPVYEWLEEACEATAIEVYREFSAAYTGDPRYGTEYYFWVKPGQALRDAREVAFVCTIAFSPTAMA